MSTQVEPDALFLIGTPEDWQTMEDALDKWGLYEQQMMAVGECGEYLALYAKDVQGRATHEEWIDEIADVVIMMAQMANIYGREAVAERIRQKMRWLRGKLEIA